MFRRGRTRGKFGTALDAENNVELFKTENRGPPREIDVVKTCNTREAHVIIRVPAVIKTLEDAVRRESLVGCHGQITVIGRV
ncbi:hypothetical protein DPMN_165799 [Dreissena polymorpha]|uniref:Uncharacterized protein n=1 Tax=Dreissena polymorpha TaxID=45954 RepID=A0A9D4IWZ8_DREPO|nr:hypothetical protein DPMN_165799 [Dreissena polymorpha]